LKRRDTQAKEISAMAKVTHDFDAPAFAGSAWHGQRDRLTIFDSLSEFTDNVQAISSAARGEYNHGNSAWSGNHNYDNAARLCRTGDLSRVAASDKYVTALEDKFNFSSHAFRNVDAITGGTPNVPAFLAGQPLNMRRRQRVQTELPPLNIVIDVASSGGISSAMLEKRGSALLALVRVLSAMRPVNLYIACATRPTNNDKFASSAIAFKLDTSPLDLARACHVLSEPSVARRLFYCAVTHQIGARMEGLLQWSYNSVDIYRANGAEYWQRVIGADEMLFVAPAFVSDRNISQPEKWLQEMIEEYGFQSED
jgi:hypothetical protein